MKVKEWTTTKTIKVGNCTVVINRPILTPEQQQAQERIVMNALAKYGRAAEAAKERQEESA